MVVNLTLHETIVISERVLGSIHMAEMVPFAIHSVYNEIQPALQGVWVHSSFPRGPYVRVLERSLGSLFCLSRSEQLLAIPSSQRFMLYKLHFLVLNTVICERQVEVQSIQFGQ